MKHSCSKPDMATRKHIGGTKYNNAGPREPVKVFCRIKPLTEPNAASCIRIISDTTLVIEPPESIVNVRSNPKAVQTTFSKVFPPNSSQLEIFNVVALPLVTDLINGKNGLLFTYGVTGSGKTYTMCGNPGDAGTMPLCLDVLFNAISNCQAKKFIFKPDKLNGFDIQPEGEAMLERQNELHAGLTTHNNGKRNILHRKQNHDVESEENAVTPLEGLPSITVDEDNAYAVFITYVEIYNNSVYDLLEDDDGRGKPLQSKIIREDGNRNMYIHGATEVEVKSSEEAYEFFQYGQRRRRIAYTTLNAESSRSHSIFTIRLVQAPLDNEGEEIVYEKRVISVSQLSLVDLAGSERTNRSKNTGQRLREAGNINNSLMTLRTCLEILRENQTQGTNKLVPYRDSKLTHLFKRYFDGDGNVRMIVCVNPSADDYDETIQVMKFAEMSQDIQVVSANPSKIDLGFAPGRRQANKLFKEARNRLENIGHPNAASLDIDLGLVYSLGGPFPDTSVSNPHNDEIIVTLMRFLEQRMQKRNLLREDLRQKQTNLRNMLVNVENENTSLKIENAALKATNGQNRKQIAALEAHICKTESQIDTLLFRLTKANDVIKHLQQEVKNKDMTLQQRALEKQKVKHKYNSKIQVETDKMNKELETKLRQQREHLQHQMKEQEQKLKLVKKILVDEQQVKDATKETREEAIPEKTRIEETEVQEKHSQVPKTHTDTKDTEDGCDVYEKGFVERIPVVNRRYRRSHSADRWIDHRPPGLAPVGTIFQPLMHRRRSVKQLIDPKDFTERASRYCLVAQEQDTDGELETMLYKGDILPTSGGGAQVVFNDMEHLKQISPVSRRKRVSYFSPENKNCTLPRAGSPPQTEQSKKPRV